MAAGPRVDRTSVPRCAQRRLPAERQRKGCSGEGTGADDVMAGLGRDSRLCQRTWEDFEPLVSSLRPGLRRNLLAGVHRIHVRGQLDPHQGCHGHRGKPGSLVDSLPCAVIHNHDSSTRLTMASADGWVFWQCRAGSTAARRRSVCRGSRKGFRCVSQESIASSLEESLRGETSKNGKHNGSQRVEPALRRCGRKAGCCSTGQGLLAGPREIDTMGRGKRRK